MRWPWHELLSMKRPGLQHSGAFLIYDDEVAHTLLEAGTSALHVHGLHRKAHSTDAVLVGLRCASDVRAHSLTGGSCKHERKARCGEIASGCTKSTRHYPLIGASAIVPLRLEVPIAWARGPPASMVRWARGSSRNVCSFTVSPASGHPAGGKGRRCVQRWMLSYQCSGVCFEGLNA